MAQDSDVSKAAGGKGKGKAVDNKSPEAAKDKDGKPAADGKKDAQPECMPPLPLVAGTRS